jgi:predicted nucleic acid-binding protein
MALTLGVPTDHLLISERLERAQAAQFGLQFIGTFGVFIEATSRGHLQEIKPVLDDLQISADFRTSDAPLADVWGMST